MSIRIAISMGDFNGIGPEIILKSLSSIIESGATPIVIGHRHIFKFYANLFDASLPDHVMISQASEVQGQTVNFWNLHDQQVFSPDPGQFSVKAGHAAMQAVEQGIHACMQNHVHALVTAPISKEAVNKAGYQVPGHTEFLAQKTNTDDYLMMLVHEKLRVGLVTTHISVAKVAAQINADAIKKNATIMHHALRDDFGIENPRIAVLGLNPHAGDGGIIGDEEIDHIAPAIAQLKSNDINVSGPYPADGFFGNHKFEEFDSVLAMYHDQGLVPFKTLSFGSGVNVTAGLPIVRTSPDHGTAFDIAGRNTADPSSFIEAVTLAGTLSANRQKGTI